MFLGHSLHLDKQRHAIRVVKDSGLPFRDKAAGRVGHFGASVYAEMKTVALILYKSCEEIREVFLCCRKVPHFAHIRQFISS